MPSCIQFFATLWTVAHQAPLFMGFPRQEYWSRLPCPPPGDLPHPGIKPKAPALAGGFFTNEPHEKPSFLSTNRNFYKFEIILKRASSIMLYHLIFKSWLSGHGNLCCGYLWLPFKIFLVFSPMVAFVQQWQS